MAPVLAAGLISGGIQAGLGVYQAIQGGRSRRQARRLRRQAESFYEKNRFEIPESATRALESAEQQAAMIRLPGQDIMEERIGATTASGIGASREAAQTSTDLMANIANLFEAQTQAEQNLGMQAAQRYDINQATLRGELGRMSALEQEKWRQNVLTPYRQKLAAAGQLMGAGTQELAGGIGGIAQAGAGVANIASQQALLNQQFQQFKELFQQPYGTNQQNTLNFQQGTIVPDYNPYNIT